jgi:ATP-binding cassette, subfamily B, bacterial
MSLIHHPTNPPGTIKGVLKLFRPYRRPLFLAQVFFLIKHSPVWIMPILTADLINVVASPDRSSTRRIWIDASILLLLIAQNIPTNYIYAHYISRAVRSIESDLRQQLIRRLQQLSMGFLDRKPSGALQSKLMRDVEAVQGLIQQSTTLVTACTISLALSIGITWVRQPKLLFFFLLAAPAAVGLTRYFRHRMEQRNRSFREHTEGLSARLMEMIHMLPLTRAHGLENLEVASMSGYLDNLRTQGLRVDMINALFGSFWWSLATLMQTICLIITISMAWRNMMPPGDVVLYNGLFAMMVGAIGQIVDGIPPLTRGLESARSIRELLDTPEIEDYKDKISVPSVQGLVEFQNVSFTYPGAASPALHDISLRVEPGETIAFVGPSGSGKTTMTSLIIGFRRPQSGRIFLDGRDMADLDLRSYRQHLAVVPQQTILFSGSVRDNITYGVSDIREESFQQVLQMARIDEFLPSLPQGLDTKVGEHGVMLSGGQRQRIAIARALMRNPRIIILDEATSALDTVSERYVKEALQHLMVGRTTFVVAHRLSTIRSANRIVVMKNGRLVEMGTHDELMALNQDYALLEALS